VSSWKAFGGHQPTPIIPSPCRPPAMRHHGKLLVAISQHPSFPVLVGPRPSFIMESQCWPALARSSSQYTKSKHLPCPIIKAAEIRHVTLTIPLREANIETMLRLYAILQEFAHQLFEYLR